MKKINFFMMIVALILVPNIVLASTYSLNLDCPSTVSAGENVSCKLTGTLDGSITSIRGKLSQEGLSGITFNSTLTCNPCNSQEFNVSGLSGTSANIGTINLTIPTGSAPNTTFRVIVNNIYGTSAESNDISHGGLSATMRVKSTDSTLSNITVGKYELSPKFSSNVYSYKVMADDIAKITINATSTDGHATITGIGEKSLKYGDNTFTIVSKSESGDEKKYKNLVIDTYIHIISLNLNQTNYMWGIV